jgi:hypothetical protein
VNDVAKAKDLNCDLGVKTPPWSTQIQLLRHLSREHFVAGFHVRKSTSVQPSCDGCQEAVSQRACGTHTCLAAVQKAGPVNHLGVTPKNRLKKLRIVRRIVFEVRILNQQNVPAGMPHACLHGGPFTLIAIMEHNDRIRLLPYIG